MPWKRERLLTLVFWPGEFHEKRSLVSYSPWDPKELDRTEQLGLSRSRDKQPFRKEKIMIVKMIQDPEKE